MHENVLHPVVENLFSHAEGKHFICRIKESTTKTEIRKNDVHPGGIVFSDAVVLLGTPYINQTGKEVRLVGYRVANVDYWIATERHDLSAEQIALAYKLRWNVEIFSVGGNAI